MTKLTDIFNFLAIDALLTTSGQPTEKQIPLLAEEGYEVVINLALHDDPRYSLPDETGLVESLGMKYIHIPVQFNAPLDKDLHTFFAAMEDNRGKKIHLHCAANMRVTAFLGLYYFIVCGQSKEKAFIAMRSIWELDEVWDDFITETLKKHS